MNVIHKEMTDEELYKNIQEEYIKHPNEVMKPSEWKAKRLKQLKKEGKIWSK